MGKKGKSGKKRSLVGRIIVILLTVLALLGLVAMIMSVLSSYVDPVRFVWFSFSGLVFWVILFYNLVVWLLLLLMWSRYTWIAVASLLIAIPGVYRSLSTGRSHDGGELRVMSYNVLNFSDQYDDSKSKNDVAASVAEMVRENHPDVLCVQEFAPFIPRKGRNDCIVGFGEMVGMPYYHYNEKANFCSNVIFSRYPLSALGEDIPFAKENDYGTVARVDAGEKGTFYVLCCHLTSFQLTNQEITVFSERNNSKEQMEEYGRSIVHKLKAAYVKRSEAVAKMLDDIPDDGRPILLCGDFNDTPMSYTYHQIRKAGFTDGFVKTGHGIGVTYAGNLPMLRIDYVWTNDQVKPMSFKRIKHKGSDHYPIMLDFNVEHGF